jgi:hypothetical protein
MLAVSSVTANIRISATANADFKAWGSRAEVAGNLNPLQSGLAYEENPTISYVPIDGAEYVRELLSPIPIELTFLLLGAAPSPRGGFIALVESINGIQNPTFLSNPDDADGRFMRCVELLLEFKHRGFIHWARSSSEGPGIGVPPAGVALILGVDRILDMSRTAINVTGDLAACVVMNRWLGDSLDEEPQAEMPTTG